MITIMRGLDLSVVLGNQENVDEFNSMLEVISGTDFSALPSSWSSRGSAGRRNRHTAGLCLGRRGDGADFVYYDPWERRKITEEEMGVRMRSPRRPLPDGHPTGHDFTTEFTPESDDENEAGDAEDADWFGGQSPIGSPSGVGTGGPAASGAGAAANADSADMHLANQVFGNNAAAMTGNASTAAATSQYGTGAALAGGAGYPGFSNANPYFGMQPGAYGMNLGVTGLVLSLIHISEPTRRVVISYAVFCLKKKK